MFEHKQMTAKCSHDQCSTYKDKTKVHGCGIQHLASHPLHSYREQNKDDMVMMHGPGRLHRGDRDR